MRRSLTFLLFATVLAATSTSVARAIVSAGTGQFGAQCVAAPVSPAGVELDSDPEEVELDETVIVTPRIEVTRELEAGDRFTCQLTIRSRRSERATFQLEPNGVIGSREPNAGYEFIGPDDDRFAETAGAWLKPALDEVTIPPRGVVLVPVTVTVPSEPPVGSAYGSINVVSRASAPAGDTVVGIESQAATVFLLPVGGEGKPDLRLVDVDAPRLRWNRDSWPVGGLIDNDGTLHAVAGGRVRVTSLLGNSVAELPIKPRTILPGGREPIAVRWGGVPWFGLYRYDVRVENAGDGPRSVDTVSGWFVALPPWWMLLLLAISVAGFLWWRRRLRATQGQHEHDGYNDEFDDEVDDGEPPSTRIVT